MVRYLIVSPLKNKVWHLVVTVIGRSSAESIATTGRTNHRGVLRSRVVFRPFTHPLFRVQATDPAGRVCRMRLDPAEVEDAMMAPGQLVPPRFL